MIGYQPLSRRAVLRAAAGVSAVSRAGALGQAVAANAVGADTGVTGGRLKQSVCRWTVPGPLPEVCRKVKTLGLSGIDLLQVDQWSVAREAGLVSSMGYPSRRDRFIEDGFNDASLHAMLLDEYGAALPLAAQAGVPNLIGMFGNRRGRNAAEGIANCVSGLSKIAPLAERHGVTVCVDLLNSKVDHVGRSRRVLGCRRISGQLTAGETPLRHLSHADYGRRCDSHHPR